MERLQFIEKPTKARGSITAGMPVLPPGVERHPIQGGGTRAVHLEAGDRFWVLDREGMQPAEFVFFDKDGRSSARMVGAEHSRRPDRLIRALARGGAEGRAILDALSRSGFDLAAAEAVGLFDEGSEAADFISFEAERDGVLLLGAVGEPMEPDGSAPLTEILLYVRRRKQQNLKGEFRLPDPLAEPVYDYTISPGNAHAYTVKAGQFAQIIDVRGRECTDFTAFKIKDLDDGFENMIDQGATRTMNGNFHPEVGLYSKYYTTDLEPVMEIVQDTCGRHDTFAMACTGRYYEDLGYFGHSNCSDNISNALAPYGVRARRGWSTINFFFNMVQHNLHSFTSGEPWSRPGDYVLLRADTDLVCVNSCCPDEIDPANGWNPSEIHVRVYDRIEKLQYFKGHRMTPGAEMTPSKKTPFHEKFAALGADFIDVAGYLLPGHFRTSTIVDEWRTCRERTAIMDLSALRKCEIIGPDAEAFLNSVLPRDIRKLGVGGVFYTSLCSKTGGMIDDGTLMRLTPLNFRWIGGADASVNWLKDQAEASGLQVSVRSSTDQLVNLSIQGRASRDILGSVFKPTTGRPNVAELERFKFTIARHGGENGIPVLISRTGFTGELGFEVFCAPRDAEKVFDLIWEAGREHGLAPIGYAALDILRIEAGLPMAGAEFDATLTPFAAGVGFTVPRAKDVDYVGKSALDAARAGLRQTLKTLVFESGEAPLPNAAVFAGSTKVGELTSITRSPALGRVIALARVDEAALPDDANVEVGQLDGAQKRLGARVAELCVFDEARARVQGRY